MIFLYNKNPIVYKFVENFICEYINLNSNERTQIKNGLTLLEKRRQAMPPGQFIGLMA